MGDGDTWQVNLLPTPQDVANGCWWRYVPISGATFDHDPGVLIQLAQDRWPGELLDVVDPDGRSYLVCAVPPWYHPAPS
jgi:hypothetical protein